MRLNVKDSFNHESIAAHDRTSSRCNSNLHDVITRRLNNKLRPIFLPRCEFILPSITFLFINNECHHHCGMRWHHQSTGGFQECISSSHKTMNLAISPSTKRPDPFGNDDTHHPFGPSSSQLSAVVMYFPFCKVIPNLSQSSSGKTTSSSSAPPPPNHNNNKYYPTHCPDDIRYSCQRANMPLTVPTSTVTLLQTSDLPTMATA